MTPQARAFLDALAKAPLLSCLGQPAPSGFDVKVVCGWREAREAKRMAAWQNVKLEARGQLTSFLAHTHPERDHRWNDLVDEFLPEIAARVNPLGDAIASRENLDKSPAAAMRWDCLSACMEYEHADLRAPGFYDRLGQLYLLGRFPCGYQGEFPHGVLEIY